MRIIKRTLLSPAEERELAKKLLLLWLERDKNGNWKYTGQRIAKILEFGKGKYKYLKSEYVYYYRLKFGLPKREREKFKDGRYKFGRQEQPISCSEFYKRLDKIFPPNRPARQMARVFNILCYYTGLRQGEIRRLRKRDFTITHDNELKIDVLREKKIIRSERDIKKATIPVFLPLEWKYVNEIVEYLNLFGDDDLVFPISAVTAWKYVKALFPQSYPHHYRLNLITELANNPEISIQEIQRWTGLSLQMIQHYLSRSERFAKTVARKRHIPA